MRRTLAALAALPMLALASSSQAAATDPIGDLIVSALTGSPIGTPAYKLKATLYHAGAAGVGARDSLGCKVVAMRTAAIDKNVIPRRTILFIQETVGMPLPDGGTHDGYWYASDVGGAIKGEKIDLFTGAGRSSMKPMMPLNLSELTVTKVGQFKGCPPAEYGRSGPAETKIGRARARPFCYARRWEDQVSPKAFSSPKSPGLAIEPSS